MLKDHLAEIPGLVGTWWAPRQKQLVAAVSLRAWSSDNSWALYSCAKERLHTEEHGVRWGGGPF